MCAGVYYQWWIWQRHDSRSFSLPSPSRTIELTLDILVVKMGSKFFHPNNEILLYVIYLLITQNLSNNFHNKISSWFSDLTRNWFLIPSDLINSNIALRCTKRWLDELSHLRRLPGIQKEYKKVERLEENSRQLLLTVSLKKTATKLGVKTQ